jgi:tetratricopeptide (TPR) repeat protein
MKGTAGALGFAAAVALLATIAPAAPGPGGAETTGGTVWERARHPESARRRELIAEAESYELRYQQLFSNRISLDRAEIGVLADTYLARAAELLEQAGALTTGDLFLRYRLAVVYTLREQHDKALGVLESIGRADPPAPLRASVFADLAVAYAHLGRVDDEITAYGEALQVQPLASERSRLIANRAEAYMLRGDYTSAVAGYRAALALLSNDYLMFGSGATTLWGLAVALDRADELDGGLDAIRLARVYDPQDKRINGPGWFYLPEYDRHWYEALGHWQVARRPDVVISVRTAAYARALESWARYIDAAARDDKWLRMARVRLLQCARERVDFLHRDEVRKRSAGGAEPEFARFMSGLRGKSDDDARRLLLVWIEHHPFEQPGVWGQSPHHEPGRP